MNPKQTFYKRERDIGGLAKTEKNVQTEQLYIVHMHVIGDIIFNEMRNDHLFSK